MMEGVTVHPLKHIVVPKGDIYHALKSTDEGYVCLLYTSDAADEL